MTALDAGPDTARAQDLDCAHNAWRGFSWIDRPDFGPFAVNYLRERGLALMPLREPLECGELPESLHTEQALAMTDVMVADLLAALAERGLRWIPGENGQCGTLIEGQPEPENLHIAFDAFRNVWQRDDDRAATLGDPCIRWFDAFGNGEPWKSLQRVNGPMTPEGGIAPTTPDDVLR